MTDYTFCNNCGKHGHLFHQCKNPITSSGIIVYNNTNENDLKFLMICRKDSLGYVDFIRGKYHLYNKRYIINIINEMTILEKKNILEKEFDDLWHDLWGDYIGIQYKSEYKTSKEKFTMLKLGIILKSCEYNLVSLINESHTNWEDPEWGFPKGRRNLQEKDLSCAIREFEEETGCSKDSLKIIYNLLPLEELFTGSNYKSYKHKYYIAYMDDTISLDNYQKSEVSKIAWKSFDECMKHIRPYNKEKLDILKRVATIINSYIVI
jgi:8-oxo-dGTP pyrophosphatase MutT (NUDIX family)